MARVLFIVDLFMGGGGATAGQYKTQIELIRTSQRTQHTDDTQLLRIYTGMALYLQMGYIKWKHKMSSKCPSIRINVCIWIGSMVCVCVRGDVDAINRSAVIYVWECAFCIKYDREFINIMTM